MEGKPRPASPSSLVPDQSNAMPVANAYPHTQRSSSCVLKSMTPAAMPTTARPFRICANGAETSIAWSTPAG